MHTYWWFVKLKEKSKAKKFVKVVNTFWALKVQTFVVSVLLIESHIWTFQEYDNLSCLSAPPNIWKWCPIMLPFWFEVIDSVLGFQWCSNGLSSSTLPQFVEMLQQQFSCLLHFQLMAWTNDLSVATLSVKAQLLVRHQALMEGIPFIIYWWNFSTVLDWYWCQEFLPSTWTSILLHLENLFHLIFLSMWNVEWWIMAKTTYKLMEWCVWAAGQRDCGLDNWQMQFKMLYENKYSKTSVSLHRCFF